MSAAASPWKPCDLRGLYPEALCEHLMRRVGAAIGSEMAPGERMVVGGDIRGSTPALKSALSEGLVSVGIDVIDCGQAPTPLLYFHLAQSGADGVCIVTASHNPAAYNGLKWMVRGVPPSPGDIERIRAAAEAGRRRSGCGSVVTADPAPAYRSWMESRWRKLDGSAFGPLIIDAGNGAWSRLAPEILRKLGFDVRCLYCEEDGRFPNRAPDCARTANLAALRAAVVESGGRLGVAWDGDGDRAAFVDETGAHVSTDAISTLFARRALAGAAPGEAVVCDIKLSDVVRREIAHLGGSGVLERSGHAFMRTRLLAERALLGLDACGHYFFREAGSRDDGLYSALYLIELLGPRGSLADMRRTVGPLYGTPELRIPAAVLDYGAVIGRLRAAFPGADELSIDGVRLNLEDRIVLARESSTEPVVSLRIEASDDGGCRDTVARCLAALHEARVLLERQIAEAAP